MKEDLTVKGETYCITGIQSGADHLREDVSARYTKQEKTGGEREGERRGERRCY